MDERSNGRENGGCIIVELKNTVKPKRESSATAPSNERPQSRKRESRIPELNLKGLSAQVASGSAENFLKRYTNTEESLVSLVLPRRGRGKENAEDVQAAIEELLVTEGYDWEVDPNCTSRILVKLSSAGANI